MTISVASYIQCCYTFILGLVTIYILTEPIIPKEFKEYTQIKEISARSYLTKYLMVAYFLPEFSWDMVGYDMKDRSSIFKAFYYLGRVLSCSIASISCIDFIHKTTSSDLILLGIVKFILLLSFAGLIYNAYYLTKARATRTIVYRVSDPCSRLILFDGCFQFLLAIGLICFTSDLSSLFSTSVKVGRIDLLLTRLIAGSSLGLSIFNFASVGLSEEEANIFIRARKWQYTMTCAFMFAMNYFGWFSPVHTVVIALYICQLVHIMLPAANAEISE